MPADCSVVISLSPLPESPDLEAGLIPNSLLLSDIQGCATLPVPPLQGGTLQACLPYPSAGLPELQSQLQPPALAEHDWRCLADQHHLALGDALEANSQVSHRNCWRQRVYVNIIKELERGTWTSHCCFIMEDFVFYFTAASYIKQKEGRNSITTRAKYTTEGTGQPGEAPGLCP